MCPSFETFGILIIILTERILRLGGEKLFASPIMDPEQDTLIVCEDSSMCKYENFIKINQLYPRTISTLELQDFVHVSSDESIAAYQNRSINCNKIQTSSFPPLVFIHLTRPNALDFVLNKISLCLRSSSWKPKFIIKYTLFEDPLERHLKLLKELVVKAGIPLISPVLVIIEKRDVPRMRTAWEMFSIKNLVVARRVQFSEGASSVFKQEQLLEKHFRNFDMFQIPILGAAENNPKYYYDSKLEIIDGELKFVNGFAVDLFRDLSVALNFTAKAVQGKGWPSRDEATSKWKGTGRMVMDGEVDIGISSTRQLEDRADFAQLMPHYGEKLWAFFHQPPTDSIRDIFGHTFNRSVWIVLFLFCLFTICMMKLMNYFRRTPVGESLKGCELADDYVLFTLASLCQQSWCLHTESSSLKILTLCITTFGFLMYVYFSAALVSALSNEVVPIRSSEELEASSLAWTGEAYVPFVVSKLESKYNLGRDILKERNIIFSSSYFLNNPVLKIALEPSAFLGFLDDFTYSVRRANKSDSYYCENISTVRISQVRLKTGMYTRKESHFREYFSFGIIKNTERGLIHGRRERYIYRSGIKCEEKINSYRADLGIPDVSSAYVILGLGFIISGIEVIVERSVYF